MAQTAKSINISKFEAGDRPTDQDFSNLFDSVLFLNNVGNHNNGLNTNDTSLLGNFQVGGNLTIQGTGDFKLNSKVSFGNTNETVASGLHVYNSNSEPVIYASGSLTNIMFSGISGDATSSIKLTDSQDFVEFGTHTGKAFISVAGSEYFNITGSNLGPHSFFSGSVGIGSVANANATERLRIFDADKNVSAHLQTSKVGGTSTIGFENDAQSYTFGVRSNDNLTVLNGSETPLKIKSNATTDNLVLEDGKVGIGLSTPTEKLHVKGTTAATNALIQTTTGNAIFQVQTSVSQFSLVGNGTSDQITIYDANSTNTPFKLEGSAPTSTLVLKSTGRIGLGTGAPATKLDVRGDISIGATPAITLYDNNNATAGPDILFDGDALLAAKADFNINIDSDGTTSPNKFSVRVDGDTNAASELFYVSSSGQVSASGGFIGDGSGLTNITSGQIALFGGDLTANNLTTINNAGTGLDGEANLTFDGNQLGVGIASPNAGVDVHINHNATSDAILLLESDGSNNDSTVALRQGGTWPSAATGIDLVYDGGDDKFYIKGYTAGGGFIGNSVSIKPETPTDTLILDENGNVGIGASTPSQKLHVEDGVILANKKYFEATPILYSGNQNEWALKLGASNNTGFDDFGIKFKSTSGGSPYLSFRTNAGDDRMVIANAGNVGIGTTSPIEALSIVGNTAIRNTADNSNVILFQNNNDTSTKADILFNASGLITSQASLTMAINSTAGNGTFDIRTGDLQNGGEGVTNTSLLASFGTGSVGSVLSMHGGLQDNKPAQIQFNLGTDGLNNSGSDDGARIKYSTVNSQGGFYDASNLDFLVFEKLDANNTDTPDGGILFTNSALGSGGDTTENLSMAIRGDGRVGIGTISPDCKLSVHAGSDDLISRFFSTTPEDKVKGIRLSAEDAGGTSTYLDLVVDPLGNKIGLGIGIDGGTLPIGDANLDNAELVIDSDGNVGIGTSSPAVKLEVVTPSTTNETLRLRALGASTDPYLSFYNENTHRTRRAYIQAVSAAGTGTGNQLRLVSDTGGISFFTSPVDGTYSTPVENFRVSAGGNVLMRHDKKLTLGATLGGANDHGFIRFNYTSDSDSSLEIGTRDNSNEPIIFTQTDNERARIDTLGIQVQERITSPDTQHTLITNSGGGYIEAKSNNSTYGLIVRDYNSTEWLNIDANSGYGSIGYNSSDGPLFLSDDDRVGINYSTPAYKLHVVTDNQDTIAKFTSTFDNGYVRIRQNVDTTGAAGILTENSAGIKGFVGYYDTKMRLVFDSGPGSTKGILIDDSGNVDLAGTLEIGGTGHSIYMADYDDGTINTRLICRDNALEVFEGGFIVGNYNNDVFSGDSAITEKVMHTGQIRIGTPADDNYRRIFMSSDRMFFQQMSGTSWDSTAPYIENGDAEGQISTFTGQHRNKPSSNISNYVDKTGYIVVSSGVYSNIPENRTKEEIEVNNTEVLTTPQIDEALPIVELSTTANDKKVFGVIGGFDDPNSTNRDVVVQGGFNLQIINRVDNRLIINSLGEGAIMVSNINGNLENGDYITTSAIEGLGMKQDDDLLHNYTVAKITQDCDFSSNTTDVTHDGQTYKMKLVGCTYHCG